ncbi:MAG TPA: lipoyl(octanoyl) transferase LipB, partial [bacterium]|nr:lipoyl(octanoyl) transferase LipB [bacterium]
EAERDAAGLPVVRIERGGATTYHGPDQQMLYPVLQVELGQLHGFVGGLQEAVVQGCAALGVAAFKREEFPGVWTGKGKIASLGLAVKRKVTLHGMALNCDPCASGGFDAIVPCGLEGVTMTHLAAETGFPYPRVAVRAALAAGWEMAFRTRVISGELDLIPPDLLPIPAPAEAEE